MVLLSCLLACYRACNRDLLGYFFAGYFPVPRRATGHSYDTFVSVTCLLHRVPQGTVMVLSGGYLPVTELATRHGCGTFMMVTCLF